jgi:hypothetical protein
MSIQPQKITTEADTLITLLQQSKELPLKDAAQKLNIPQETLEAWASFLEEEGLIAIKYKFTTPYLTYIGDAAKSSIGYNEEFKKKLDLAGANGDISAIEGLLQTIEQLIKQGDFPRLPDNYDTLISKIRGISENISEKNPEHAEVLGNTLRDIEAALAQAQGLAGSGKFDDATKNYLGLQSLLSDVLVQLKSLEEQVTKKKISEISDIQTLLEQAYSLMNEGKIDEANQIYQQLNSIYAELPHNYVQKKQEIERTMAKLNRDLAASADRKHITAVQQGSAKIMDYISQGNSLLKKNSLADAESVYLSARQVFSTLPPGFLAQKRKLQEGLLKLYEAIALGREKMFMGQFNEAAGQLQGKLQQIYSLIDSGKINDAVSAYGSAKKAFDSMPSGFLNDKLTLQSKLLEAYNRLVAAYQSKSTSDMQAKTARIDDLLAQIASLASSGIYDEASKLYSEVRAIFKTLPPGFLKEKTELQQKILDTYESLITVSGHRVTQDVRTKVDEVNKILDEAFNFLKHNRDGLAHELYMQSIILYNKLPGGFLQSKSQLRSRMLALYRDIITRLDTPAREEFTESAESKYREILKLIVNVRHSIVKRQFDLIEPEYLNISKLFSQLPIGFAQRSTQLMKEMKEIGQEVKLYKLLGKLQSLQSPDEIQNALIEINPIKQFVAQQCPEDTELISYAEAVYSQYMQRLDMQKRKTPAIEQAPSAMPPSIPAGMPSFNEQPAPIFSPAPDLSQTAQQPSLDELQEKIRQLKERAKPDVVLPAQ